MTTSIIYELDTQSATKNVLTKRMTKSRFGHHFSLVQYCSNARNVNMPPCSFKKCKNHSSRMGKKDGISFFRFPHHELRKEDWRKLVARERREASYKPNDSSVICSSHFLESDVYHTDKGYKRLKRTALPQIEFDDVPVPIIEINQIKKEKLDTQTNMITVEIKEEKITQPQTSDCNSTQESSNSETIQTTFYKKELKKYQTKLVFRDRQVRNLKKQNLRLRMKNSFMKDIIKKLKKNNRLNDDLCNDRQRDAKNVDDNFMDILSGDNNDSVE